MNRTIKHYILYKNEHYFSSFPSITLIDNKQLLLLFRRARDSRWLLDDRDEKSHLIRQQVDHVDSRSQITRLYFNLDLSISSKAEALSINADAADQDASLLQLNNNNLLLSSFSWYPVHYELAEALREQGNYLFGQPNITGCAYILWGVFSRLSHNQGRSWSSHNYLPNIPGSADSIPGKRGNHGGACRGQAIEVNNEILLAVYGPLKNNKVASSHLYVSNDQGQSWHYRSIIASDKNQQQDLNEPSLLHLQDNKIMAFMRNSSTNDQIVTALSHDTGLSWEDWQERGIIGHPTHPLKLSDGRIFICYGYRHKPYGIRAHLLDSSAEQLLGEEIIIRDDAACGDIGYPWSVEMPDGQVLVVYYFTLDDGIRHIAASLLTI